MRTKRPRPSVSSTGQPNISPRQALLSHLTADLARDAHTLEVLQQQLVRAQAKAKAEDEMETKGVGRGLWDIFTGKKLVASTDKRKEKGKAKAEDDPRNFERGFRPEDIPPEIHNLFLWEEVLTSSERTKLEAVGIQNMEDLYAIVYNARTRLSAKSSLTREKLDKQARTAMDMLDAVNERVGADDMEEEELEGDETSTIKSGFDADEGRQRR